MSTTVTIYKGLATAVPVGGTPIMAVAANTQGGFIQNPASDVDQGIALVEPLFIDLTGPASVVETTTTFSLQPGQVFTLPANLTKPVWVNAATSGHKFSNIVFQPSPQPPTPTPGTFPPSSSPTVQAIIPSYLYVQYNDDEDLQAFVNAYNTLAQEYLDWFNTVNLPIYTNDPISGELLNWVGEGLYGLTRPSLGTGNSDNIGPPNTYGPNQLGPNMFVLVSPTDISGCTDDIYRRIITWHFFKGDGKVFNIEWLKRRVMRFLIGVNGTAPPIDETYRISVIFEPDNAVLITILPEIESTLSGPIPNTFGPNRLGPNQAVVTVQSSSQFPQASVFAEAVAAGVLELPFQFTFNVDF